MRGARGAAARRAGKSQKHAEQKTKKKQIGLFNQVVDQNEGLTLQAEPLDFLGRGNGLHLTLRRYARTASIVYEQLAAARQALHSGFFFAYLVIFTLGVLNAMEGETLYDHHSSLVEALTKREWYYDAAHIRKDMYDVYTVPDFFLWMRGPFISELLPEKDSGLWDAWQGYNASRPGNFHTNLWLLAPITLRQIRVHSDSCKVSSNAVIADERTKLDYIVPDAYVALHHLYSNNLALDSYVSNCRVTNFKAPPAACGRNQSRPGDWAEVSSRSDAGGEFYGMVGRVPGCYADVKKTTMAKEPYGPIDPKTNMSMWKWNTAKNLRADSWVGRSQVVYPGSGYNVTLAMDPEQARKDLKFLDENRWMDLATRAVFVELLVYNPNVEFASLIKLSFEFRPGQETLVFATYRHMSIHQLYWSSEAISKLRYEIAVLVMVIVLSIIEVYSVLRLGHTYLYNGWHVIAIFNYALYYIGFAFRAIPFVEAQRLGFPPPVGEYRNFENAFLAHEQWKYCMAINSILVWMRCFEHLTALPFMGYIIRVLGAAVSPILVVCISFSIVSYAFALAYVLAFSGGVHGYRTIEYPTFKSLRHPSTPIAKVSIPWTITTMSRQLRGLDDFDQLWEENRLLGPAYFLLWTIIGAFIFLSLFVVVLLEEVGDISKQFNIEAITKKLANMVRRMKLAQKNEQSVPQSVKDEIKGIDAELSLAVKRQAQRDGKTFVYGGVPEQKKTSAEELLILLDKSAKDAGQDYCEITKDKFREIEETVRTVSKAVDQLKEKLQPSGIGTSRPRTLKTAHSVRSLTATSYGGGDDIHSVRRRLTSKGMDTGLAPTAEETKDSRAVSVRAQQAVKFLRQVGDGAGVGAMLAGKSKAGKR